LLGVGGASLFALMAISVSDATMRVLDRPFVGAKEVSEAFLVSCVAIALPISVYRGKAVAIEGLVTLFPDLMARIISACGNLLGCALCALLSYELVKAAADARDFAEKSALLSIPFELLYQILAVGVGLTALAFLYRARLAYQANERQRHDNA